MDDLASKLSEFLNNPESLEKIKGLSGLLGQNSSKPQEANQESKQDNSSLPPDAMNMIMKIMPLLSNINQEDDNTRLLMALRPMLKEPRQKKVDDSIRMMNMMKVMPLLKSQDIFG